MPWHQPICHRNVIIFVAADALAPTNLPPQCNHLCGCWCPDTTQAATTMWSSSWLLMPCQCDHLRGCWCPVNVIIFVACQGINSHKDDHIVTKCTLALSNHVNHCFSISANIVAPPKSFPPSTSCNIQPIPLTSHPSWPLCDLAFIAGIIPVTVYEHIAAAAASDSLISTRATTDDSWH